MGRSKIEIFHYLKDICGRERMDGRKNKGYKEILILTYAMSIFKEILTHGWMEENAFTYS